MSRRAPATKCGLEAENAAAVEAARTEADFTPKRAKKRNFKKVTDQDDDVLEDAILQINADDYKKCLRPIWQCVLQEGTTSWPQSEETRLRLETLTRNRSKSLLDSGSGRRSSRFSAKPSSSRRRYNLCRTSCRSRMSARQSAALEEESSRVEDPVQG